MLTAAEVVSGTKVVLETRGASGAIARSTLLELVDVFAELDRRTLLATTLQRSARFGDVMQLVSGLHEHLDRDRLLNTFATDGAAVLGASRIFVGCRSGRRRWNVEAATAVSRPNPRADEIRKVAKRFHDAAGGGQSFDSESLIVRPVCDSGNWASARYAVQVESDEAVDESTLGLLIHHLRIALDNSRRVDEATAWGRLKRLPRAVLRPSSLLFLAVVGAVSAWLWFGTAELTIPVYGEAVPVRRDFVYAPEEGTVTEVLFTDQAAVDEGELLVVLKNEMLELENERLRGEIATTRSRLLALETVRGSRDRAEATAVSAELARLRIELDSLDKQLAIVQQRIDTLGVHAELAGSIFVDGLAHEWVGRPVRRGEPIAEVADRAGDWELQLRVPERDVRHVLNAMRADNAKPKVSFVFETSAEVKRETVLDDLELAVQVDERGELSTQATALLSADAVDANVEQRASRVQEWSLRFTVDLSGPVSFTFGESSSSSNDRCGHGEASHYCVAVALRDECMPSSAGRMRSVDRGRAHRSR